MVSASARYWLASARCSCALSVCHTAFCRQRVASQERSQTGNLRLKVSNAFRQRFIRCIRLLPLPDQGFDARFLVHPEARCLLSFVDRLNAALIHPKQGCETGLAPFVVHRRPTLAGIDAKVCGDFYGHFTPLGLVLHSQFFDLALLDIWNQQTKRNWKGRLRDEADQHHCLRDADDGRY